MVPGKDSILLGTDHTVYKFYDTINQPYARPNAVLLVKVSDMLDSSNFVRLFHCQSFALYGIKEH